MDQVSTTEQAGDHVQQAPLASTADEAICELPFQFMGNASEYFRIWVVNTLLTIATLGVYSAWAKVRTNQYFYRNTFVDGRSFDYLARPIPILKGRLLVAAALGLVSWSHFYYLPLYFGLVILLMLATPWVFVKSLAFKARNSAYCNIRFAFPARVGEAFGLYLKIFFVYAVTCGLALPWTRWTATRFVVYRHYYGDLQFTWHTKVGAYYRTYLTALILVIPGYAIMFIAMSQLGGSLDRQSPSVVYLPIALLFAYLLIPAAYVSARMANLLYEGLMVGDHAFVSKQRTTELLRIYATNALAILLSVGLLIPWAQIRLAKYRADTLILQAAGRLYAETLLEDDGAALGEGMADLGDFELGIGT